MSTKGFKKAAKICFIFAKKKKRCSNSGHAHCNLNTAVLMVKAPVVRDWYLTELQVRMEGILGATQLP